MRKVQRLLSITSVLLFAPVGFLHASITGAVIDGDGKAIAGARVSMVSPETLDGRRLRLQSKTIERVVLATTQSDSKGNFTLQSPKEPVVDIRVEAPGFAPDAVRSLADDDLGAIALTRAALVKGTITALGKPVAGATVGWSGTAELVALTDAEGIYSVPDPAKWASRLTVVHPDFAILDENITPSDSKKGADRTLKPGVAIGGRVLAEDGQTPVAGAAVIVDNWRLATTADDGSFTVAHAMKDWAQVEAQSGEKAGVRARSSSGSIAIRLGKAASVTGSVVDLKTQLPIAGAEVRLNPNTPGLGAMAVSSRMAFTDAKGRFSLKPVVPGIYQLAGSRPAATITGTSVSVNAGQSVSKPLYLTARGRISGSVIDEDRRPVGGARVIFRAATSEMGGPVMVGPRFNGPGAGFSAPDGHFVLRSVTTDSELRIEANRKGYPAAHTSGIRLSPGERKSGVLLTIPHGLSLSGKVTDHDGKPLSGVSVDTQESSAEGQGGMRRMMIFRGQERGDETIRTASDGTFLTRVKEGTYDVILKREGFAVKSVRGVAVSPTSKPMEITLDPGVEVSGRVTRGGTGVEGVNVGVGGSGGFTNTVTQADGSFVLADLSPGPAMLSVNKPDAFVQQMRPVTIPARDVIIDLPQGGRITGRVVDKASKHPVTSFQAGVTTSRSGGGMVFMAPPMLKAFTSDDGSFALDNVPPGSTEVVVNAPGYTTGRVPALNVEDGKTLADVEVAVETGVTLTGRVTGPDGSALSGVEVRPDQSPGANRVMRFDNRNSGVVTDPRGEYVLDALEPGEKTFEFSRQGLVSQSKTVALSGDKVTLNVQLSAGVRVSGVVVNEGGGPVSDAMVEASSATDSSFGRQARSDSSGNFQLEGLVGGHYTLSASKKGFASAIQRDVDLSAGTPIRLVLTAGGVLSGHVTGLSEKELQQTTVFAWSPTGEVSAPVDTGGGFRIEGAPLGTVRVYARVGGGMSGIKTSSPKTVQL
ncbi:MAG: carboxypeptidase-like regulatory domain-containing protein, partial [Thermoanaerobaculia bacterium]